MTREERLTVLARARVALKEKRARDKIKNEELRRKAEELAPTILANSLLALEDEKFVPAPETIQKVRAMLDNPGMTMERLRSKYFPNMSDKGWGKLANFIHQHEVPNTAAISAQLYAAKRKHLKRCEQHLREVKKQIRESKRLAEKKYGNRVINTKLLEAQSEAMNSLFEAEIEVAKFAQKAEESKNVKTSAVINIHTTIPRPPPLKDVTPVTLQELVANKK